MPWSKIFYLLKIEDLADQFQSKNGHPPSIKEWAEYVKMPLIEFRNKLSEGYTAIEKIIKLNLGLIVHKIERTESLKFFSFQEALRIGAICLVSAAKGLSSPKEIINYPRYSWAVMSVYMPNIAERIAASSNLNPNLKKKIFEIKEKREFF